VARAISTSIVIYSYKVAGEKSTDEFVELKNIGANTVNIAEWQLAKKTASGTKYNLAPAFPSIDILPGESFVIGHQDSTEPIDLNYQTAYSVSEDNTIILYSDAGKTVVDRVGFGKASDYEGAPAPAAKQNIWVRRFDGDTDHNANDFVDQMILLPKDYSGICLTEIMIAPGEGDEWIEIYNSEVTKNISGLVIADLSGSTKQFVVPDGTMIEEGQYLVFYGKDTGLALNNDSDGVRLVGNGEEIDSTGLSGAAKTGFSYAFDGEKWQWSKTSTPGDKNIITLGAEIGENKSLKSRKKASKKSNSAKALKGKAEKAEVKGASSENLDDSIFNNKPQGTKSSDGILGIILIALAILGGIAYTLYVNKEKLRAVYNQERPRYQENWNRFRKKIQGGRNFSFVGRFGCWKDAIHKRFGLGSRDKR
jgi:hypothetical protein